MQPLHDEELILYIYGESPDASAIRDRIEDDPHLRARIEALRAVLERINAAAPPVPPADLEGRLWQRIAPDLAPHRQRWWVRLRRSFTRQPPVFRQAMALAAVAALVVVAFVAGRSGQPPADEGVTVASERILLTAVGEHLSRSQMLFLELANADLGRNLDALRQRDLANAGSLLSDNRFYRLAATQAGQSQLVAVLNALERVLTELANLPEGTEAEDLEALRRRIADQDLLFKVRVITSTIDRQTQTPLSTNNALPGESI